MKHIRILIIFIIYTFDTVNFKENIMNLKTNRDQETHLPGVGYRNILHLKVHL